MFSNKIKSRAKLIAIMVLDLALIAFIIWGVWSIVDTNNSNIVSNSGTQNKYNAFTVMENVRECITK